MRHFGPRLFWVLAAALTAAGSAFAGEPRVTGVTLTPQGSQYEVVYDLDADQPVPVVLLASEDGGKTFDLLLERVFGDVGEGIAPGKLKKIFWNPAGDFPGGTDSLDLTLDVVAGKRAASIRQASQQPTAGR